MKIRGGLPRPRSRTCSRRPLSYPCHPILGSQSKSSVPIAGTTQDIRSEESGTPLGRSAFEGVPDQRLTLRRQDSFVDLRVCQLRPSEESVALEKATTAVAPIILSNSFRPLTDPPERCLLCQIVRCGATQAGIRNVRTQPARRTTIKRSPLSWVGVVCAFRAVSPWAPRSRGANR